jgi:S-DNA-T family DNA segregation ATPase FtsK/SpoIIIE
MYKAKISAPRLKVLLGKPENYLEKICYNSPVMASKKKEDKKKNDSIGTFVKRETKQGILTVVFFVLAAIFVLAPLSRAGLVGSELYLVFSKLFGIGYYLIPIFFLSLSISFFRSEEQDFTKLKVFGGIFFFVSGLGIIDALFLKGGLVGSFISTPLLRLFSFDAALIILFALLIVSCLVLFETKLTVESLLFWKKKGKAEKESKEMKNLRVISGTEAMNNNDDEDEKETPKEKPKKEEKQKPIVVKKEDEEEFKPATKILNRGKYVPPPLSLLEDDKGRVVAGDIKANANVIKRTLQNFGIDVEMDEVSIGPSVTRYALKPAEGVKLAKIVALQNDLALALAAHPLRIEAPIPGKSLVGIEIPNTTKSTVGLASLIGSEEFQSSDKPLLVTLGKGISGKYHFANLAKMPHVLVAGSTGSGKSVTIHSIITSLLYRNGPEDLKFIMVDPKRVELTLYNKIPHLLTPVITDAKKTILAIKWATKEMDRRYDVLESHAVKDIDSYHKNILAPALKKVETSKKESEVPEGMPYIVIVIDELADIMATYPRELEAGIVRLAQMSRAVGIHLILSTQRPSVNVITGLIKANVPARIALQVVSQVDSRTILDTIGAEKLLGAGDMLYIGSESSKPVRIQSAFISEKEVKDIAKYLIKSYEDELIGNELDLGEVGGNGGGDGMMSIGDDMGDDDELYEQAKEEVLKAGKASTSYIQRKLRVGYARAARLIDLLEQKGVVGPADGAKPREVIGLGAPHGSEEISDEGSEL